MKTRVQQLLEQALAKLRRSGAVPAETDVEISINRGKQAGHGDFATNLAMLLAKPARRNPRELAEALIEALPDSPLIERVEVAGPGFINFFLTADAVRRVVAEVLEAGEMYGRSRIGEGQRVLIEFVSANPTGPLHVGHGRGAAYGAALADLLAAAGYRVEREYYVNDAGRQMDILAASTWLRYLEAGGRTLPRFPDSGYRGDYIRQIAGDLRTEHGDKLAVDTAALFDGLPADGPDGDKEAHIDALVARLRELGGTEAYRTVFNAAMNAILDDIRDDLAGFGVHFDNWFMESSLTESGEVKKCMDKLKADGRIYEKEGALWFASSGFGDEKDRVVQRDNGQPTYFASDIAYHLEKTERGYDKLIDIWGADHHGYMARVRAAMQALDLPEDKLDILLVQFAILYRGKEKVPMSTRAGEFVTLRELRGEVGDDAARFFYIMRRSEQHMDFDLELAKSQSNDNPVYYVQYAHARIASVFKQLEEKSDQFAAYSRDAGLKALHRLDEAHESALLTTLSRYPEVVEDAAVAAEPHQLTFYVRELANEFHSYYNAHQFLVEDAELRNARLALVEACGQVLRNALSLIGVSAPDSM